MQHRMKKKAAAWILVLTLFTSLIPESAVWAYSTDYANTYTNTGNMAYDIAQVALTQVGYTETDSNHTKYNAWFYGTDKSVAWCGIFIAWCANQAGIPSSVIAKCGLASGYTASNMSSNGYGCPAYAFGNTSAQVGDIIFVDSTGNGISNHVGLVYAVDSTYIYTVEGNSSSKVARVKYLVSTGHRQLYSSVSSAHILFYARPNYSGSSAAAKTTALVVSSEGAKASSESSSASAKSASDSYTTGSYTVSATSLNVRSSADASADIAGRLGSGTAVEVTKVSGSWGYVSCKGISGWVCMSYLVKAASGTAASGTTSAGSSSEAAYKAGTYKVNTEMNVRSEANTDSTILGTISAGSTIVTTAVSGRFGKITYKGRTAWVSLRYSQLVSSSTEAETSVYAPVKDTESQTTETAANKNDAQTYKIGTYTVDRSMNIRSAASTEASILGVISGGTTITVTAVSGRFGKITYKGQTAWVSLKYAKLVKAGTSSDDSSDTAYTTGTYKVNISSLNVRSGADTTYSTLGVVFDGETYKVSKVSGRFGQITYKGQTGWISLKYCVKQ